MRSLKALRRRTGGVGAPPRAEDTFETLERPAGARARKVKTGRTEQFNIRVADWFAHRIRELADHDSATLGEVLEAMLALYEASGGGLKPGRIPVAEARAGRIREVRFWASEPVFQSIGRIAAERGLSVSALMEEWQAQEVARLDPQGEGKFGVFVERG
jgi:hypothetical protein